MVWHASRGHGFTSSFAPYPFFGQHFSPALGLFVPLYWIHPSPLWLLGAQSFALGTAIVPLYLLARTWLDRGPAFVACAAYTPQIFILRAVGYDFHTEALAVPFVFLAVLGAARGSRAGDRVLLLSGLVPMLCKEDGALVSLGIGILAWAVFRRRTALVLIPAALLYGLVVTTVVMPAIRDGQPGDLVARYSYLGSSVPGILLGLVTRPELIVIHLLSPGPLLAVVLLLGGVGFLPLARPLALAAALPPLLLALLSQHWQQETLLDQYGLQPGPLIFVGALIGWVRLSAKWSSSVIGAALLASTLAALALAAPAPALGSLAKGQAAASLANALPPDASVDASNDLLPMLAERDSIGLLPARGRDWIAVDESMESTEFVAELGSQGYVLVRRSGELSLWRRQAQQRATYG